jgi:hypothetical protein
LMAAFYRRGKVLAKGESLVQVNRPCILIQQQSHFAIVDPTQKGKWLKLRVGGKLLKLKLPAGGAMATILS